MTVPDDQRVLVEDGACAVLGAGGDITGARGTSPDGLFLRDARHLSRWQLTLDGAAPSVLVPFSGTGSGADAGADAAPAAAVLTPPGSRDEPPAYTVFREQAVTGGALVERIRLTSHSAAARTATLALTVDADFADQFELRSQRLTYDKPGAEHSREILPDGVEFGYRRGEWHSRTVVGAQPAPGAVTDAADGAENGAELSWTLGLPPHGTATVTVRAAAHPHGGPAISRAQETPATAAARQAAGTAAFVSAAPRPRDRTGSPELIRACEQGLADLALLRIPATGPDGETLRVPAAGVPWFLTLFGRDALLTSLFALPYRPELAAATLPALAATQATAAEPERVAEPGKIVHEIRHGELAHFGQVPYGRYYGSVDGTPLFLVLLGAWTERGGDRSLAMRLEDHARAAVEWMFRNGLAEHGYLRYEADREGLANQNWKDSPGAICSADGTPATGAIAAAEVQGYAYDALRHTARLARTVWDDPGYAERLESAAGSLRDRFQRDFWLPEQEFVALALDGAGRPADALASDAGHLLWSGLLDEEHGRAVGRRLLEPDFFSGWGIRTLAAGQGAYHPLSYHRGSVWPHDNAVIALGLARYGLHREAAEVADGLSRAAARLGWRLPEVLSGHGSEEHPEPVPYPHACSPQAWAAATPLALLTAVGDGGPGS